MQAYEFYAKPVDGMIPIPEDYRELITDEVDVIVLEKHAYQRTREKVFVGKKTDLLSPPAYNTKGWKFDREEANAR
jgi:calcineurin-like phosphoesterase